MLPSQEPPGELMYQVDGASGLSESGAGSARSGVRDAVVDLGARVDDPVVEQAAVHVRNGRPAKFG